MAKLIYTAITSLDGYPEDDQGGFDWAAPDVEVHVFLFPIVVGGGKPGLPRGVQADLELLDERRFAKGAVHLHHRTR